MIESVADRVSSAIDRHNADKHVNREVMRFALIGLMTNGMTIVLSVAIGIAFNRFVDTLFSLAAMAAMRFLTGGHHIRNPILCILLSTFLICIVPYITLSYLAMLIIGAISLALIGIFAPADLKEKTRISDRSLLIMKVAAMILVISNLLFLQSDIVATAFGIASLALISFKQGGKR